MSEREDLLAAVHRRAARLRRRRAAVVAGPAALVLAVGAGGVWWSTGGSGGGRLAVSATTATTRARSTTTTSATDPTTSAPATSTTTLAATTTAPPTTRPVATTSTTSTTRPTSTTVTAATVPPTCHDSYDPACGAFQWQPAPGANHGVSVTLAVSDLAPHAGDPVSVTVDATDADAVPACASARIGTTSIALTDSLGHAIPSCPAACPGPTRYGPWTPPAPNGGSRRLFGSFTAAGSGAQQLTVSVDSGSGCHYLPYGSTASTSSTVTVQ